MLPFLESCHIEIHQYNVDQNIQITHVLSYANFCGHGLGVAR